MKKNKKPKVVFTFIEAGLGHIVPATGIADAFEKKYGDKCEIVRWKIFSESKSPVVKKYGNDLVSWVKKATSNKLMQLTENFSDLFGSKLSLKVLDWKFHKAKKESIKEIVEMDADLICSTFYSPSHFALEARKQGKTNPIIATYTADPIIYPAWDRRSDLFFVTNDFAYNTAIKTGFDKDNVVLVPFVYKKEIEKTPNQTDAKALLGLANDKFTILLSSGAYGTDKDKKIINLILQENLNINLIIICGKNKELYDYYSSFDKTLFPNTNLIVQDFTDKMFLFNSASDLMIGKSGSNSIMESFYFETPVFVSSLANNLERKTANYFMKKRHCGEIILNPQKLVNAIKLVVQNPKLLEVYKANLTCFHNEKGAEIVADKLYDALIHKTTLNKKI